MRDSDFSDSFEKRRPKPALPFLVGVGGWAYLPLKKGNKLEVAAKLYDFVEVNSTFYDIPLLEQVKRWRKSVPEEFDFTVRASKELTHTSHLEPTNKNFKIFERMMQICKELHSNVLHFQFPPSLKVTDKIVSRWSDFFGSVTTDYSSRVHYAIEVRSGPENSNQSPSFERLLSRYDLIPTSDASRSEEIIPSERSGIVYTRVFGPGEHTKWTFDTNELINLSSKIKKVPARKKYVTFHNLTMYEDASRMKTIAQTGSDQNALPRTPLGLESLRHSISSGRMRYPATKQQLLQEFGWKIYDLDASKREHVSKALEKLLSSEPAKKYSSPDEVIREITDN